MRIALLYTYVERGGAGGGGWKLNSLGGHYLPTVSCAASTTAE